MDHPLFCDRCLRELSPGRGDFFVVRIDAVADPFPPVFTEEDLACDPRREIEALLKRLESASEREMADDIGRRVVLTLCTPCFRTWIENPTG